MLCLDEPTLGLDPQSRSSLWEFITALPEKYGVTIFMTTHYMDEAEVCDNIAIIDNGNIIAMNSPEELKKVIGRGCHIFEGQGIMQRQRMSQKSALILTHQ